MAKAAGHFGQSYDPPSTGLSKVTGITTEQYQLPVTDVQTARRNFPGYTEAELFTIEDMKSGQDTEGTTDTDAETHGNAYKDAGYTKTYAAYKKANRSQGGKALSINPMGSGRGN